MLFYRTLAIIRCSCPGNGCFIATKACLMVKSYFQWKIIGVPLYVEQPQLFIALSILRSVVRMRKRLSNMLFLKCGNIVQKTVNAT